MGNIHTHECFFSHALENDLYMPGLDDFMAFLLIGSMVATSTNGFLSKVIRTEFELVSLCKRTVVKHICNIMQLFKESLNLCFTSVIN